MKALIALLTTLLLCSCAPESKDANSWGYHMEVRSVEQGHTIKGRFFFIHGMGQDIAALKTSQWARMGDFMHGQDFEVIYIGWDFLYDSDMSNKGQDYINRWQNWIVAVNTRLQTERPVAQTFFGGSSMGAWHSIIASEVIQTDAVYAIEPVVHLEILWPFAHSDTSVANLTNVNRVMPTNLFVTVGLSDTSVGFWYEQDLFKTLLPASNYKEYPNEIHFPYQDQFDDTMTWLAQQIH